MASNVLRHVPGSKRYYAVEFAAQPEVVNGETLTGTAVSGFDIATDLTATLPTISATQVRFWLESTGAAALGNRIVYVTVTRSGGATIKEGCRLEIVSS